MNVAKSWFDVDKEGLAKLVERRGKSFIVYELLQNAWDCSGGGVTRVLVDLSPIEGRPLVRLTVTDDHPDGFANLAHAYTLFAESEKKGDPTRRGRFNLGEKLVLALCEEATITSTKGAVHFDKTGRHTGRLRREAGTDFSALVRMTRAEWEEVLHDVKERMIPPAKIRTMVNGYVLPERTPLRSFMALLQTEVADEHGFLRRRFRDTTVELHQLAYGEKATLYEMGIPVMELGDDPYHVVVGQKIPLTMERDAAPPSYIRDIRTTVLDHMHEHLDRAAAVGKWAAEAIETAKPAAVKSLVTARFGDKVVIADPSDREGENIAKSRGYTVIPGGAFTAEAWDRIRESKAALPAGQVTPSPKPFRPDGEKLKELERDQWTPEIRAAVALAKRLGELLLGQVLHVSVADDRDWPFEGTYSRETRELRMNYASPAIHAAIKDGMAGELLPFLIHEFAHHYESNHLAEGFHEACCKVGAALAVHVYASPDILRLRP